MWDLMFIIPMVVGTLMIAVLLFELARGRIGFLRKTLGIHYDHAKQRFELSTGPVFGIVIVGAALIISPIVIDHFLVTKRTFFLSGEVRVAEGDSPRGVRVIGCYPLTDVLPDGTFLDVRLYKDETGRFPQVAFELPGYETRRVPINDDTTVKVLSGLRLKDQIALVKKTGN